MPVLSNKSGALEALASVKTIHEWQPIIFKQWERNRAISACWNEGIEKANSDYILVVNDDVLFHPTTIDYMIEFFENLPDPNIIMVTAVNDKGYVDENYGKPQGIFEMPEKGKEWNYADHPDFSCFMVNKDLFELAGKFDENFIPAYFEDNDMHLRIHLADKRAVSISNAPYYHYASQSEKDEFFHKCFESNRNYFSLKWGAQPMQPGQYGPETFKTPFNDPELTIKDW